MLVIQLPVCGQVGGDDAQQVVGITEQPLCLQDMRYPGYRLLESGDGIAVLLPHGDEHEGLEPQPDRRGVHDGPVAADRPAALQVPHAPVARRDAQPYPGGQVGQRQAAILFQLSKNLPVDGVHTRDYCSIEPYQANVRNTFGRI